MQGKIDIQIDDSQVRQMVDRLSAIPQRTREWFKSQAAPYMRRSFEENFRSEGRPDKWQELSDATASFRREGNRMGWWQTGDYHPILQRTGDLMKMVISTEEDVRQSDKGVEMELDPVGMMTRFGHSAFGGANSFLQHQEGIGVAKRAMVMIQNSDITWMTNRYQDFLNNIVKV